MDTENFLIKRRHLLDRLEARRARDLSGYPFRLGQLSNLNIPFWARWALTLVTKRGLVSNLLQVGIPLAASLLMKKHPSWLQRLLGRFSPSEL